MKREDEWLVFWEVVLGMWSQCCRRHLAQSQCSYLGREGEGEERGGRGRAREREKEGVKREGGGKGGREEGREGREEQSMCTHVIYTGTVI